MPQDAVTSDELNSSRETRPRVVFESNLSCDPDSKMGKDPTVSLLRMSECDSV